MTIDEIREKLRLERDFGSRFPVRVVFAENLDDYKALENMLTGICDVTMNVADFCGSTDTVPRFDRIREKLAEYNGRHVLLLSVGEYLRLCEKRELDPTRREIRAFWEFQQAEFSKTRVVMPLFRCRDIFERAVGSLDERQQDFLWTLDSASKGGDCNLTVYSPEFAAAVAADAGNLKEWLLNWKDILTRKTSCTIVTSLFRNAESTFGSVTVRTFASSFGYLKDALKEGRELFEGWLDDGFWSELVKRVLKLSEEKESFQKIVLDELNTTKFDFVSVASQWNALDDFKKNLVWLWYRLFPSDDYYCHACVKASRAAEIPERVRDEFLQLRDGSERWLEERMAAVRAFSFPCFGEEYFTQLDRLTSNELKLRLLTCATHEEKKYAVKVVSAMLREGAEMEVAVKHLKGVYPSLASYMLDRSGCDEDVDDYMAWYRKNKLVNRNPGEPPIRIDFERFDARNKLISDLPLDDRFSFWIDGFGAEYVPVFLHELKKQGIVPTSVKLSVACLPTETEYNHQWDENDPLTVKMNTLDSLSHKGMPDDTSYYSCVVNQLSAFSRFAKKVGELLKEHNCIVVTGDHGSSRFAALAFHEKSVVPIALPKNARVRCHGRFCELDAAVKAPVALPGTMFVKSNGQRYLIMTNYQHFSTGGNAAGGNTDERDVAGEVHGGNTAEERLVPVIVIKRNTPLPPIKCKPQSEFVFRKNGRVEALLTFDRPVSSLKVLCGGIDADCTKKSKDGRLWNAVMSGVTTDTLDLSVVANGCLLPSVTLRVKTPGIKLNDDFFGEILP